MRVTYQVMSINSGPRFRILSIRSKRFCSPCAVLGGKNSKDQYVRPSFSALASFSVIFMVNCLVYSHYSGTDKFNKECS